MWRKLNASVASFFGQKMPSVMDTIRFREGFNKLSKAGRERFIADSVKWLNDEGYVNAEGGQAFSAELVKIAGVEKVPVEWYTPFFKNHSKFMFMDKFLRRLK